jgi:hypothetical protein
VRRNDPDGGNRQCGQKQNDGIGGFHLFEPHDLAFAGARRFFKGDSSKEF